MLQRINNLYHLFKMARVLAKHDALFFLREMKVAPTITFFAKVVSTRKGEGRAGERLAKAMEELGPTFIKLGQLLSTRPDIVGEQVAKDLSQLQDQLPPFPFEEAKRIIEEEFECELKDIYPDFDEIPVAAASIAQVHLATDRSGNPVAVKVLRPDVEEQVRADLGLFYWIAEIAEQNIPSLRRLNPIGVVKTFEESLLMEMDLRFEAAAATELAENFKDHPKVKIPKVYWRRTSMRVLTLERIYGMHILDKEAIVEADIDINALLKTSAEILFTMVFRDGFFHADMHPGNIFVEPDGTIVLLDFGIMGRLDHTSRRFLAEMLYAFLNGDYKKVADIHFDIGYVPHHHSKDLFSQACRSIAEPILGLPQNEISIAKLLEQLFKVADQFDMEVQTHFLLLQKNMMLVEGVGRQLNPNINIWKLAEPLIHQWARKEFGPEGQVKHVRRQAKELYGNVSRLLETAVVLEKIVTPEGLKLHPDTVRHWRRRARNSSNTWLWGLLIIALSSITVAAILFD